MLDWTTIKCNIATGPNIISQCSNIFIEFLKITIIVNNIELKLLRMLYNWKFVYSCDNCLWVNFSKIVHERNVDENQNFCKLMNSLIKWKWKQLLNKLIYNFCFWSLHLFVFMCLRWEKCKRRTEDI